MFFAVRGHFSAWDGEYFSRKGALRVRISLNNHTVDLVVTHLVGESLDFWEQYVDVNEKTRQCQTKELLSFVESSCSDSDLVVLGGDFNFDETDESYIFVTEANLTDTGARGQDEKKRVTWGHPENKWGNSPAYLIDYVFVRSNKEELHVEGSSTIPEKAFQ